MSFAHPRTMGLSDPGLPAVSTLLGTTYPPALRVAIETAGGELIDARVAQVSWWPGRSITVRYNAIVSGGELAGNHSFVCVGGRIPPGATVVEGEGHQVGVWRVPNDPALPGMVSAVNPDHTRRLLADLGSVEGPVTTRLRAYRPGRRAVVEVQGVAHSVYLKVVRPSRVDHLHQVHRALAGLVPIPESHGVDDRQGIVALQTLPGITLRQTLDNPDLAIPPVEHIVGLVATLPQPFSDRVSPSAIERMPSTTRLLRAIAPELGSDLDRLTRLIGEETQPADHPSHGDYYEAQVMVQDGEISGLVDVDTYGWGRAADDAATMLGHLAIWSGMSKRPHRVNALGSNLLGLWDNVVDPQDLRKRTAAVILSLAAGPFRVQSAAWPSEVAHRVAIAEHWLNSTSENEKSLIAVSG